MSTLKIKLLSFTKTKFTFKYIVIGILYSFYKNNRTNLKAFLLCEIAKKEVKSAAVPY